MKFGCSFFIVYKDISRAGKWNIQKLTSTTYDTAAVEAKKLARRTAEIDEDEYYVYENTPAAILGNGVQDD
jgi:hypothetical protein